MNEMQDSQASETATRKLELYAQIRELKAESARLSAELARSGSKDPIVIAAMSCW